MIIDFAVLALGFILGFVPAYLTGKYYGSFIAVFGYGVLSCGYQHALNAWFLYIIQWTLFALVGGFVGIKLRNRKGAKSS